ncbi:hypothetical protein V499_03498 [Pseudogymnoascus sp. VKM F-103]|uniref:Uncharacterized protein n=1 Tax=Pseudogymnoascus verrucosus TaxID=342668 RepID=A0A1B8GXY3_9PEZI|nr:uncharacterized protein VE01_01323 [Pseudogymnoascus verrucosus]KFY76978.1 hypothetical protein V499_03498 [Pseudogymnoascus sp. VKM F-103]OBU00698.1 hypothetical protein VE01_01323 [Pseudogymnoascus verrucosus]
MESAPTTPPHRSLVASKPRILRGVALLRDFERAKVSDEAKDFRETKGFDETQGFNAIGSEESRVSGKTQTSEKARFLRIFMFLEGFRFRGGQRVAYEPQRLRSETESTPPDQGQQHRGGMSDFVAQQKERREAIKTTHYPSPI